MLYFIPFLVWISWSYWYLHHGDGIDGPLPLYLLAGFGNIAIFATFLGVIVYCTLKGFGLLS